MKIELAWAKAALVRALKTFCQVLVSMITVGVGFDGVNWVQALSVSLVAGIASLLTSVAGLPEAKNDGTITIDSSNPEKTNYSFDVGDLDAFDKKKTVILNVKQINGQPSILENDTSQE